MKYIKMLVDLYRLKRQAKMSKKQLHKLQEKKLRKLLHYAFLYVSLMRRKV